MPNKTPQRLFRSNQWFIYISNESFISGAVSIVFATEADYVCWVSGSKLGGDHMSVGCGGPALMLANLYRLPKKL